MGSSFVVLTMRRVGFCSGMTQSMRHERASSETYCGLVKYFQTFSDLAGVCLEESWVLEVAPSDDTLALRVEAVLTPEHPLYEAPKPGELSCYRRAWLSIRSEDPIDVRLSGARPAVDATGERDLGHVDGFAPNPMGNGWELEGDWGEAVVRGPEVTLLFD